MTMFECISRRKDSRSERPTSNLSGSGRKFAYHNAERVGIGRIYNYTVCIKNTKKNDMKYLVPGLHYSSQVSDM